MRLRYVLDSASLFLLAQHENSCAFQNCMVNSTEAANYDVTPVLESSRITIRSASGLRGSLYFIHLSNFLRQFILEEF